VGQQPADPGGRVLAVTSGRGVLGDVSPVQFQTRGLGPRHHEALGDAGLTGPDALDFRAPQDHATLEGLADLEIVASLAVLDLGLVGGLGHGRDSRAFPRRKGQDNAHPPASRSEEP